MRHLRKWTFTLLLLTSMWSCGNDDEIKPEERLIGHWDLSFSEIGSVHELSPIGGVSYGFKPDKTFIKKSGSSRDEGTYLYNNDSLSFNYKTYTNQISDTKTLDLKIEKITSKELVFKVDYNNINILGEFVEFEFIHYIKNNLSPVASQQ